MSRCQLLGVSLISVSVAFTACISSSSKNSLQSEATNANAPILLFNGTETSPNDVAAFEAVLDDNHLSYSTVNSSELNQMSEAQLRQHRLLIVPGGDFMEIGKGLPESPAA